LSQPGELIDPTPRPGEQREGSEPSGAVPVPPASEADESLFPVVGLGASAGGLDALTEFFQAMPADSGMAFVVVTHLDPGTPSALGEILARVSRLPVQDAVDGLAIAPNHVYVLPPNTELTLVRGILHLAARPETPGPHLPVDAFLVSLARDRHSSAIGVVLSGTGSDGTRGLKEIKEEGGITFAQDQTAHYSGMSGSAIAAGCVDAILPPAQIAAELVRVAGHLALARPEATPVPVTPGDEQAFHRVIRLLSDASGVDFLHYKSSTLRRRVERRMVLRRMRTLADYYQCLHSDPVERALLFEEVLIPVTSFFRDPEVFEALQTTIFRALITNRPRSTPIRIWVPGCATGEEAYSLAICLLECLGQAVNVPPVKIFATDISERAIEVARAGVYRESIAAEVSAARLQRFFQQTDRGYEIIKDVRDLCLFARQDVTRDPPFSQLDLISCRNVLIYLDSMLQSRVLSIFHHGLKPGGYLVLGSSETVGNFTELFELADQKSRIYVRTMTPSRLTFDYTPHTATRTHVAIHEGPAERARGLQALFREVDRKVLSDYAPAGVVIDENLTVVQFRGATGRYLQPAPGPPDAVLLLMAREGLLGDLRGTIERARRENRVVRQEGVRVRTNDHFEDITLSVMPITDPGSGQRYYVVLFEEAGRTAPAPAGPHRPSGPWTAEEEAGKDREIARLEHELEETRAYLQSVVQQKDAGNEELRGANEEIVSANEELQSANEELETAKEELHATREELTTVNHELQNRIRVANQLGDDLANLVESINIPIVVLDADLRVRRFTPSAQRVLHLVPGDIGRPLGDSELRLELPDLETLVHEVIDTLEIRQREVTDGTGAWYKLYLRPYKTLDLVIGGVVVMLIDITALKQREQQIQESRDYAVNIVETVRQPLLVLDGQLRVRTANRSFYQTFQATPQETEGRLIYELGNGQWNIPRLRTFLEEIVPSNEHIEDFEVEHDFPRIGRRAMLLNACRVIRTEGEPDQFLLLAIEDVTVRKEAEADARRLAAIVESSDDAIIGQSLEGTIVSWNAGAERIFGYSAGEAIGQPFAKLVPAQRSEELRYTRERILHGERGLSFRTRRVRKDGVEIPIAATVSAIRGPDQRIIGFSAIERDVTEQERGEEELRAGEQALAASEARLRAVVDTAVEAILTIDERGTIESVNPATEKLFGYSAEELIGHDITLLMPPPYREEHDGYLARYLQTGEKRIIGIGREVQVRRKDGFIFPVDLAVSEFQVQGRRLFTGAIRDISARKQLEREVLEVATLEQRRIGQALHDSTGQELSALALLAQTLQESLEKNAPAVTPLATRIGAGLQRVLSQVRAYSRGLIPVEVDARGLRAALTELALRTRELHGIQCHFDCPGAVEVVDNQTATHLFHIAQEAVTNALRHANPSAITISLDRDGPLLTLRVHDDGIGLPPEPVDCKGMGLKIMAYRAGLIHARFHVERGEPAGTIVTCTLSQGATHGQEQDGTR
jgi:two-component system CheB/CheR fusion protein